MKHDELKRELEAKLKERLIYVIVAKFNFSSI